jgi:hypothetical protein
MQTWGTLCGAFLILTFAKTNEVQSSFHSYHLSRMFLKPTRTFSDPKNVSLIFLERYYLDTVFQINIGIE